MSQHKESEASDGHRPTVFVVDDDNAMRRGLEFLVSSAGYMVNAFDSAQAFLDYYRTPMYGCLLLDVRMPGMSGLELLDYMRARNIWIPVIFVTAFGNIPLAVRAVKTGAFDFIEKPFNSAELLSRIRNALVQATQPPVKQQASDEIQKRLETLTPREREVMRCVITGMLNKQIAGELSISVKTVESHRAQVMEKMRAQSLADLVRMTIVVDISPR